MEFSSTHPAQTQKIAKKLVSQIKNGRLICLYGKLGSGKTTFIQGIAKALGIKKRILSPTFVLMRSYDGKEKNLLHIDLYRINTSKELTQLGFKDILNLKNQFVVIEWADRARSILPRKRTDVFLKVIKDKDNERQITIRNRN